MIQYDESMSPDDMVSYWADGFIIVPDKTAPGLWKLVRLSQTPLGLGLFDVVHTPDGGHAPGDKSERITSMSTFFRTAILHRPPVHVITMAGSAYKARWAPPDRHAGRALTEGSLGIEIMHNGAGPEVERYFLALEKLQTETAEAHVKFKLSETCPGPPPQPDSLTILLHYLNCLRGKYDTAYKAITSAIANKNQARSLDDDTWVVCDDAGLVHMWVGAEEAAVIGMRDDGDAVATAFLDWGPIIAPYLERYNEERQITCQ